MKAIDDMAQNTRASGRALWKKLKPEARRMRRAPTPTEKVLWERLRDRRLGGFKFRRQHAIGRFVVDFFCAKRNLVVEIDGQIHESTREMDAARDTFLSEMGLKVIRFENGDVLNSTERILQVIFKELEAERL